MDADHTAPWRPLERAGRAAARYQARRDEIEPLIALLVDIAVLGALLARCGPTRGPQTPVGC